MSNSTELISEEALTNALEANDYYIAITARALGVTRNTVYRYMEKYGIPKTGRYGVPKQYKYDNETVNNVYYKMLARCYNKNATDYKYYGARGIVVFDGWVQSRDVFAEYVMHLDNFEKENYTLDRIDNSEGYFPGNVRWASKKEQMNNTRRNRILEFNGKMYTLAQLAEKFDISQDFLKDRLNLGFSIEEAITVDLYRKRKEKINKSSKYKGVSKRKCASHWEVTIYFHGKAKYIGCFTEEVEAATAYDDASEDLYGDRPNKTKKTD